MQLSVRGVAVRLLSIVMFPLLEKFAAVKIAVVAAEHDAVAVDANAQALVGLVPSGVRTSRAFGFRVSIAQRRYRNIIFR